MEQSVKGSIIKSLEYTRQLCSEAEPENWPMATLAAMTVLDSTMEMLKDNC